MAKANISQTNIISPTISKLINNHFIASSLYEKIHNVRAYCPVWCMTHIGYKALGSYPREHETLIPFKQLANNFFSLRRNGEKKRLPSGFVAPGGIKGEGIVTKTISKQGGASHLVQDRKQQIL
jgi:hypothetical protein